VSLIESGINSRAGAKAKVDNNYFKNSKDVLGTFYTTEAGYWQVSGNIFDNVTWSAASGDHKPAGPNPTSNTTVSIPYPYTLDGASCVPEIVAATAGANKGLQVSNGNCVPTSPTAGPTTPAPTTPVPTTPGGTTPPPSGTNLSIGAGADGSSKAGGTSYGDVRDGSLTTYWSPSGTTGTISIKWSAATSVSRINLREATGATGLISAYRVLNGDTGAVLKTGSGAGVITFSATSLKKITFEITSASGTPRVAEFETYSA
jgi:pectate lyase